MPSKNSYMKAPAKKPKEKLLVYNKKMKLKKKTTGSKVRKTTR